MKEVRITISDHDGLVFAQHSIQNVAMAQEFLYNLCPDQFEMPSDGEPNKDVIQIIEDLITASRSLIEVHKTPIEVRIWKDVESEIKSDDVPDDVQWYHNLEFAVSSVRKSVKGCQNAYIEYCQSDRIIQTDEYQKDCASGFTSRITKDQKQLSDFQYSPCFTARAATDD